MAIQNTIMGEFVSTDGTRGVVIFYLTFIRSEKCVVISKRIFSITTVDNVVL